MKHGDIMAWGARMQYPFLQIGLEASPVEPAIVLLHGREHYQKLNRQPYRCDLASPSH